MRHTHYWIILILSLGLGSSMSWGAPFFKSNKSNSKFEAIEKVNKLTPFEDIVVIQRKYFRKTLRAELSVFGGLLLSSPLYINTITGAALSFYFLEKHGLEFRSLYSFGFERGISRDLKNNLRFSSKHLVDQTKSALILSYKFIPIYGKMSWMLGKIIPFESYVTVGAGAVQAICAESSPSGGGIGKCKLSTGAIDGASSKWDIALSLGAGQSYVINKNFSVKIDLNWIYYGKLTGLQNQNHSDILISIGGSLFLPYIKESR